MLKILKKATGRPILFLMGDMRELGQESQQEHEEVARAIVEVVDELYCVGPLTSEFVVPIVKETLGKQGKTQKVEWYKNAIQAGLHLKEQLPAEAILLIKGSQNTLYLEEAIKFLLENQTDVRRLTRQDEYWMKTKQEYFNIE
jgi:UDP-N-acetylmuramyl pentapeptide synthase